MDASGFVAFDADHGRIYVAGRTLAFFDIATYAPLGSPPIDLGGDATDVVYDPGTRRIFVAVTRADGPVLKVFGGDGLAEVPGSPIDLPGGPGIGTGDLLLRGDLGQLLVALPEASQLAGVDPSSLQPLPRTPVSLRARGSELTLDPQRERIYLGSADGQLEAVGATDFAPVASGFPRRIGDSVVDLAFDLATQQLVAADAVARQVVVLDALTLDEELDSPIDLDGAPVSVEVMDLR
jgi:hypothetical protein